MHNFIKTSAILLIVYEKKETVIVPKSTRSPNKYESLKNSAATQDSLSININQGQNDCILTPFNESRSLRKVENHHDLYLMFPEFKNIR